MAGLRERNRVRRRNHLLDIAWSLFGTKGYDATSMEEIAQAAEVSLGTLYNFFPTKSTLLAQILAGTTNEVEDAIAPLLMRVAEAPHQTLLTIVRRSVAMNDRFPKEMRRTNNAIHLRERSQCDRDAFPAEASIATITRAVLDRLQRADMLAVAYADAARLLADLMLAEYLKYLMSDERTAEQFMERMDAVLRPLWPALLKPGRPMPEA